MSWWNEMMRERHTQSAFHEAVNYLIEHKGQEPEVCKHFGCGVILRSQEICCGGYCVHHQKRITTLDLVGKYISK